MKLDFTEIDVDKVNAHDILHSDYLELLCDRCGDNTILWSQLSKVKCIPLWILRKHSSKWRWAYVLKNTPLSEEFVEEHFKLFDLRDIAYLCRYQELSDEFIRNHADELDWVALYKYGKLSDDLKKEFSNYIGYFESVIIDEYK